MEHWKGVLNVSSSRIATSLCFSPTTSQLTVPSRNVIMFMGDRVEGSGNPVIERFSDVENVASTLVSKLGSSVNAWVIEAPSFTGPFAVYKGFLGSTTRTGEPKAYEPCGFPAATTTTSILANCLQQVKAKISHESQPKVSQDIQASRATTLHAYPKTVVLGFSKGGVVLNQLLTELAHSKTHDENLRNVSVESYNIEFQYSLTGRMKDISDGIEEWGTLNLEDHKTQHEINLLLPPTPLELLESIEEFHYVDVGLNCCGAYQTDPSVIQGVGKAAASRKKGLHIWLHGTPRQWDDCNRPWIPHEKNKLLALLEDEARSIKEKKLHVSEKLYFANRIPSMQMHFEIIENLVLS